MALQFTLNREAAPAAALDCVVIGAFADKTLTPAGQAIDEASGGRLRALLERGDLSGRTGSSLVLHDLPGVNAPRVLVLGLGFALLTVPLARSSPRQQRYGRLMLGFLAYLVGLNLMFIGVRMLAEGRLPAPAGLWWLTLPLLAFALWLYLRDGRLPRPRRVAA